MKNLSLCSVPWTEVFINPQLQYSVCCKENAQLTKKDMASATSVADHMNSKYMQDLRYRFVNGDDIPECEQCWQEEQLGRVSRRHRQNKIYTGTVEPTINNFFLLSPGAPEGFMISTGNQCQLRCISCNPGYSRSIIKDYEKLGWDTHTKTRSDSKFEVQTVTLDDVILEELKKVTPGLTFLILSGGEPTLSKPLLDYLVWCVDQGHNQHIKIQIHTNAVNIKPKFLEALKRFENVKIVISIDGVGSLDEYLRWPTNWQQKIEVVNTYMSMFQEVSVHTVVYSLNCLQLDQVIKYVQDLRLTHNLDFLQYPNELSIEHLPDDLKQLCHDRLKNLHLPTDQPSLFNNALDTVLERLAQPSDAKQWQKCQNIIKSYNSIRPRSLGDIVPELTNI